jgi:hypothetical protein
LAALASAKDHYLQKMEKVYSSHSYKWLNYVLRILTSPGDLVFMF